MFEIFKKLRALCARNETAGLMSRSIYQGKASTIKRRRGTVVKHLPIALAAMLFASVASAFPPIPDYTGGESKQEQRIELVRAAFHITHHPSEWPSFDPASVFSASMSDRISIESVLGGNSMQRRRAAQFVSTSPKFARLLLEAYYPGIIVIPG